MTFIVYLIIRSFVRFRNANEPAKQKDDIGDSKKVSKSIGEYVDFEEIKKDNR